MEKNFVKKKRCEISEEGCEKNRGAEWMLKGPNQWWSNKRLADKDVKRECAFRRCSDGVREWYLGLDFLSKATYGSMCILGVFY